MTHSWQLSVADINAYCVVSGDYNSIHLDADAARAAGFPDIIAHGMLTLGRVLVQRLESTGTTAISGCSARFAGPVHPGNELQTVSDPVDGADSVRVSADSRPVLSVTFSAGEPEQTASPPVGRPPEDLLDRTVTAGANDASSLATALGATAEHWFRRAAAKAIGLRGVPVVPTLPLVLPTADGEVDTVALSRRWARSAGPVVHGAQSLAFRRPVLVGESLRSRQWPARRYSKQGRSGELRFTEVAQVITDADDRIVVTAVATLLATGPPS